MVARSVKMKLEKSKIQEMWKEEIEKKKKKI